MSRTNNSLHDSTPGSSTGAEYLTNVDTLHKFEYYRSLRHSFSGPSSEADGEANYNTLIKYLDLNSDKTQPVFKPSGKEMAVKVVMLDGSVDTFHVDKAAYGLQLFEIICKHNKIEEDVFFGITYREQNTLFWLEMDKKIVKQRDEKQMEFEFVVKYYPYDIDALRDDLTRYFLCLQVRQDILNGSLRCTQLTCVLLGAYIMQSEAGDFDPGRHIGTDYISSQPLAPKGMQTKELLEKIAELHRLHKGLSPEEADRAFLHNAKKLALYGIHFHPVTDEAGNSLNVGVYYDGLAIYRDALRIKKISWRKIIKFTNKNKDFQLTVRPPELDNSADKSAIKAETVLTFKSRTKLLCERLFRACVEHHKFFRLRDRDAPKKPQLMPGFVNKIITQPKRQQLNDDADLDGTVGRATPTNSGSNPGRSANDLSTNGGTPGSKDGLPVPVARPVQRKQTVRKPNFNEGAMHLTPLPVREKKRPTFQLERWQLSPSDATLCIGIDAEGLDTASKPGDGWQGIRANKGLKGPGRYFYETQILEEGPIMVGWSSNRANFEPVGSDHEGFGLGVLPAQQESREAVMFLDSRPIEIHSNPRSPSAEPASRPAGPPQIHVNDFVGCLLDFDPISGSAQMQWLINGRPVLPREQILKVPAALRGELLFPTVSMLDSRVLTNFGETPFVYPPSGGLSDSGNGDQPEAWLPANDAPAESVVHNKHQGWRMNPWDADDGLEVSPNGLDVQSALDDVWHGVRANQGVCGGGKYYLEVTAMEDGSDVMARIGWSTEDADRDLGVDNLGWGFGADRDGFGINGTQGKKLHDNEIENYGEAFLTGDIIGCLLDLDNGKIYWSKNGVSFDTAYTLSPDVLRNRVPLYPACALKNDSLSFNFGNMPFAHPEMMKLFKNTLPIAFTPACYLVQSKRRKPDLIGRYAPPQITTATTDRVEDEMKMDRFISINVKPPLDLNDSIDSGKDLRTTIQKSVVETGPHISAEKTEEWAEELDAEGNKVRVTTTTHRRTTKTTITTSSLITTDRQEDELLLSEAPRIVIRLNNPVEDPLADEKLNAAIMAVTELKSFIEFYSGEIVGGACNTYSAGLHSDI